MILVHQKLIWLMALIAIFLAFAKLKSGYFLFRPKALKLMTYGCVLLALGTTVGLAGHMGLLGPGYSLSMIYFIIESVMGYIVGWTLVIWGMILWLPYLFSVTSRLQKATKSISLYESITKVSSYGDASPTTFSKIASAALENYGYQGASIHILSRENRLSLFASIGLTEKSKELINSSDNSLYSKVFETGEIFQTDESIRIHKDIIIETTNGPVVEALAIPVDLGIKRVGVLTVYTDHPRVFSQEELRILEAVSANLGLAFYRDGLQRSIQSQQAFRDFIAVILKTSRSNDNLNTCVIRLAKLLRQFLKFNSVNLYLKGDGAPHVLDFNLPTGGNVVIDKGYFAGDNYIPVRWVMSNNRGLTLPDNVNLLGEEYKPPQNTRTIFTPVVIGGEPIGVLNVSVKPDHKFGQNDIIVMEAIASVISGSVLEEMNNSLTTDTFDKIGAVKYSLEAAGNQETSVNIYRELARIIVENTPSTFCRIMLLDNDRKRFQTAAIYQRRELLWDERTITGLPLAELYTHRKVMATGKPEIISDNNITAKISKLEANLLMPKGISQCMIIPIITEGKTAGVVTIGESRSSDRNKISSHQLVFAVLLTNVISMSLMHKNSIATRNILADSNRIANRRLRYYENQADTFKMIPGFNSRINGPLAGILASCEYLKNKPNVDREELNKYLDVINRNAEKIHKLSGQFAEAKRIIETIVKR